MPITWELTSPAAAPCTRRAAISVPGPRPVAAAVPERGYVGDGQAGEHHGDGSGLLLRGDQLGRDDRADS
ncbi:hypothetical protein ACWCRC_39545, partial [Streptomyces sp. NPDC001940]